MAGLRASPAVPRTPPATWTDGWRRSTPAALPTVLVHGDFHPGNVVADGSRYVVLDWGDSFVGHPGFDILRLSDGLADCDGEALLRAWVARWRAAVPGSNPERALDLLRPLAALRNASVYAGFLERIEPSEHPFHAADVPYWLAEAARSTPRWRTSMSGLSKPGDRFRV